jgi:hypothetical protein
MEAHLDVVIQMASYNPLETLVQQGVNTKGASTLRPLQYFGKAKLKAKIV